jgi:hypothetical protein
LGPTGFGAPFFSFFPFLLVSKVREGVALPKQCAGRSAGRFDREPNGDWNWCAF